MGTATEMLLDLPGLAIRREALTRSDDPKLHPKKSSDTGILTALFVDFNKKYLWTA